MDPMMFSQVEMVVQQTAFADGKISVISASTGHFSGMQVAQLVGHFPHSSDQIKALKVMQPRIWGLTCSDVRNILNKFSFAGDKVAALEIIGRPISDPANNYIILESFSFQSDKERAQLILDQNRGSVPGAFPGSAFPGSAGGFPASGFPPTGGYPGPNPSAAYPPTTHQQPYQQFPPGGSAHAHGMYPQPTGSAPSGMYPYDAAAQMQMAGQAMGHMMGATMGVMGAMGAGMQSTAMGYPPGTAFPSHAAGSAYPPPGSAPAAPGSAYPPTGSAYPPPGSGYPPQPPF
eukprot:m.307576 g.307576  ORF g.307576 m.307576 type:complete len:289 (+) comp42484_c0_seq1:170-1036(+)